MIHSFYHQIEIPIKSNNDFCRKIENEKLINMGFLNFFLKLWLEKLTDNRYSDGRGTRFAHFIGRVFCFPHKKVYRSIKNVVRGSETT